jgi:hypothetical protein
LLKLNARRKNKNKEQARKLNETRYVNIKSGEKKHIRKKGD